MTDMTDSKKIAILIVISLVILFPITSFITTSDLAIFLHGAKTIVEGGKIYVDFIDIKPPVAFYSMIPVYLIAGMDNATVRIIEYIIHSLTTIGLGLYLYKKVNFKMALFASIAYSLFVVTLNIPESFQLELIFNFLIIILYIIHLKIINKDIKKSFLWIILEGLIIGFYFSIKYTMGLVLVGLFTFDLFYKKRELSYFVKYYFIISISFLGAAFLCHLSLLDREIFAGFKDMMGYLKMYVGVYNNDLPFLNIFFKETSLFFIDKYSIGFLLATSIAIILWFRDRKHINLTNEQLILAFSIFLAIFSVTSAIIEKKPYAYHFARAYIPLAILIGFGIDYLINFFKKIFSKKNISIQFPAILIIISLLIFTPIPRFIAILRFPIVYYFNKEEYINLFQHPDDNFLMNYKEIKEVGDYINTHSTPSETLLMMNAGSFDLAQFQNLEVINKFSQSSNYYGAHARKKWREEYLQELLRADWITIHKTDYSYISNAHLRTTYESLQQDTLASRLIDSLYDKVFETPSIIVKHKKTKK